MMHSVSPSFCLLLLLLGSSGTLQLVQGGLGIFTGGTGEYVDTERPPHQCTCSTELACDDPYDCWCKKINHQGNNNNNNGAGGGCHCRVSAANTPYINCQESSECCDWDDGEDRRRRRVLRQHDPNQDLELASLTNKCGDVEYDVSLHIQDVHLSAVATPSPSTNNNNNDDDDCPLLVAHAVFDRNEAAAATTTTMTTSSASKELIIVWDDVQHYLAAQQQQQQPAKYPLTEQLLHMGTFPLAHLIQAYQETSPSSSTSDFNKKGYNVWTNNCASFLVNLASTLDIKIDARVTTFVVTRLLQQPSGTFIRSLRESFVMHHDGGRHLRQSASDNNNNNMALTDHDLVEFLVEQNAKVHTYSERT